MPVSSSKRGTHLSRHPRSTGASGRSIRKVSAGGGEYVGAAVPNTGSQDGKRKYNLIVTIDLRQRTVRSRDFLFILLMRVLSQGRTSRFAVNSGAKIQVQRRGTQLGIRKIPAICHAGT